ncbi:IS200/IS605 family transposase [Thermodesulfobacteriota bacterium]
MENIIASDNIPLRCGECAKSSALRYHRRCSFCQDLEFEEGILCDLNRAVQEMEGFECHAFEPRLNVVSTQKMENEEAAPPDQHRKKLPFLGLLNSDEIKYQRALALQKLKRDPDAVYMQLKYHFSWNVFRRTPLFSEEDHLIEQLSLIFHDSGTEAGGFVHLLHLAPDHVHLFVESDGELSVEQIVNRIKEYTHSKIFEEYPVLTEKPDVNNDIWDDAYFVETVS